MIGEQFKPKHPALLLRAGLLLLLSGCVAPRPKPEPAGDPLKGAIAQVTAAVAKAAPQALGDLQELERAEQYNAHTLTTASCLEAWSGVAGRGAALGERAVQALLADLSDPQLALPLHRANLSCQERCGAVLAGGLEPKALERDRALAQKYLDKCAGELAAYATALLAGRPRLALLRARRAAAEAQLSALADELDALQDSLQALGEVAPAHPELAGLSAELQGLRTAHAAPLAALRRFRSDPDAERCTALIGRLQSELRSLETLLPELAAPHQTRMQQRAAWLREETRRLEAQLQTLARSHGAPP